MKDLRRLASAASAGGWHVRTGKNGELDLFILDKKCKYIARMWVTGSHVKEDAAYIAAANPSTIIALLDRLDECESLLTANAARKYFKKYEGEK